MNDITLKLECPCGAGVEMSGPDGNRAWMMNRYNEFLATHAACLKSAEGAHRVMGTAVQTDEQKGQTYTMVRLMPGMFIPCVGGIEPLCKCGHGLCRHDDGKVCVTHQCTCEKFEPVQTHGMEPTPVRPSTINSELSTITPP